MNLKTHIKPELWSAIVSTYETQNYSHAILDAMHYLSDVLREKTGLNEDGIHLVGHSLGGNSPKLRVNKLQTESEQNIQKGLEQILRGLYQAIRNPRSHEQIKDTQETADAIIYFIHYLVQILDQSQESFTKSSFLRKVFDPKFPLSDRYANLLADTVPVGKRFDILEEIFRKKAQGPHENIILVGKSLLKQITNEESQRFLRLVEKALSDAQEDSEIQMILEFLSKPLWLELNEAVRLRVENFIIKSIETGEADLSGRLIQGKGRLGVCAIEFIEHFISKEKLFAAYKNRLSRNKKGRLYIFHFFVPVLHFSYDSSNPFSDLEMRFCFIGAVKKDKSRELENLLQKNLENIPDEELYSHIKEEFPWIIEEDEFEDDEEVI